MHRAEIDQFLREQGTGVLSLADAGETYAPPMSFGYDGDRLYFVMIRFGDDSTKLDFADTTTRATLTTTCSRTPTTGGASWCGDRWKGFPTNASQTPTTYSSTTHSSRVCFRTASR